MCDIKLNHDEDIIKIEEKEKMLNEENAKDYGVDIIAEEIKDETEQIRTDVIIKTGEVEKMKKQFEDSQKELGSGIRVPIGGIKIPGFLRSRPKDKNKDTEDAKEGDLEPTCIAQNVKKEETKEPVGQRQLIAKRFREIVNRIPLPSRSGDSSEKIENQDDAKEENVKRNIINSLKVPLISVLPKKFMKETKEQKKDMEMGTAGLASMETLEDSKESNGLADDGMETVKLDVDDAKDIESQELASKKKKEFLAVGI